MHNLPLWGFWLSRSIVNGVRADSSVRNVARLFACGCVFILKVFTGAANS